MRLGNNRNSEGPHSVIEPLLPKRNGDAEVSVRYGKVIVNPARGRRIRVQAGEFRAALATRIPRAHAGVTVEQWLPPGADTTFAKPQGIVDVLAVQGAVTVRLGADDELNALGEGMQESSEMMLKSMMPPGRGATDHQNLFRCRRNQPQDCQPSQC